MLICPNNGVADAKPSNSSKAKSRDMDLNATLERTWCRHFMGGDLKKKWEIRRKRRSGCVPD
jgi:hypothetical protein